MTNLQHIRETPVGVSPGTFIAAVGGALPGIMIGVVVGFFASIGRELAPELDGIYTVGWLVPSATSTAFVAIRLAQRDLGFGTSVALAVAAALAWVGLLFGQLILQDYGKDAYWFGDLAGGLSSLLGVAGAIAIAVASRHVGSAARLAVIVIGALTIGFLGVGVGAAYPLLERRADDAAAIAPHEGILDTDALANEIVLDAPGAAARTVGKVWLIRGMVVPHSESEFGGKSFDLSRDRHLWMTLSFLDGSDSKGLIFGAQGEVVCRIRNIGERPVMYGRHIFAVDADLCRLP